MRPQPAGEETVPVGYMYRVARSPPGGSNRSSDELRPRPQVVGRIAYDRRPSRGAGGCVNAGHLRPRHGKHAERIVVPQVHLGGDGEPGQVCKGVTVVGVHTGGHEGSPVVGHVEVGVPQRPLQALQLQGLDFISRGQLDRLESPRAGLAVLHSSSSDERASCHGRSPFGFSAERPISDYP